MNRVIAVCAARTEELDETIEAGRQLADREQAELVVLLTQRPHLPRAESLEAAAALARRYDAELHVHYTEHAEEMMRDLVRKWRPLNVLRPLEACCSPG